MTIDPQTMLCLVVVRQLGGGSAVSAKTDILAKGLKTAVADAMSRGWLRSEKIAISKTNKQGKTKPGTIDGLALTVEGESVLRQAADPVAHAAAQSAQMDALRQQLEADRQALRVEVLAAISSKSTTNTDPSAKEMTALSTKVADLAKRLEAIESHHKSSDTGSVLSRIDQAFARLGERLATLAVNPPKPLASPGAPATVSHGTPYSSLRTVLKSAYDDLRSLAEYEDGLVPLPKLYYQAKDSMPTLTIDAFHKELQRLWDDLTLELQILNEVRTASDTDKAIRRGDNLYYFVLWHNR